MSPSAQPRAQSPLGARPSAKLRFARSRQGNLTAPSRHGLPMSPDPATAPTSDHATAPTERSPAPARSNLVPKVLFGHAHRETPLPHVFRFATIFGKQFVFSNFAAQTPSSPNGAAD